MWMNNINHGLYSSMEKEKIITYTNYHKRNRKGIGFIKV